MRKGEKVQLVLRLLSENLCIKPGHHSDVFLSEFYLVARKSYLLVLKKKKVFHFFPPMFLTANSLHPAIKDDPPSETRHKIFQCTLFLFVVPCWFSRKFPFVFFHFQMLISFWKNEYKQLP